MTSASIVITCYNLGAFLQEALDSALAQTHRDFEVLLVDDGSTDPATVALLDRLPPHPRLRVLRTANQGVARARNYGIGLARGGFILPLDADDRIHPEYLERAVELLLARPAVGFVGCHFRTFGERETEHRPAAYRLPDLLIENSAPVASVFRRECWERSGGYCPELNSIEDWDQWIAFLELGYEGAVLPEIYFEYRVRPGSNLSLVRDPDIYERRMRLLYERHQGLYDRYVREVLLGKDRQFALLHSWALWQEQQARNWERAASEQQAMLQFAEASARRSAVRRAWLRRQRSRWQAIAAANPSWSSRLRACVQALRQAVSWRLRLTLERLAARR